MGFSLSVAAATDVGRKRQNNEDCYLTDPALGLYVVADGIGGKRGGEEASKLAAEVLRARIRDHAAVFGALASHPSAEGRAAATRAVEDAVQAACYAVHQRNVAEGRRMGTTLSCVVHAGAFAVLGHVGDSRIYLVRQGAVHRLTEDHTIAAMQLKAGGLTREEAEASRFRGVLTRSIGSHESVPVDTLTLELANDDALLLCTDGLHMYMKDEGIPPLLDAPSTDPSRALVDFANNAGGADNVTAIVIRARATTFDDSSTIARLRIDAVRHVPLLAHLSYKEQAAVMSVASARSFAPGEMVVREGEQGSDMFIVVSGRVSVERHLIPFAELGPGGHFGEMALVEYAERSASVRALEQTETLVVTQDAMGKLMRADPVVGVKVLWALVQAMSARLRSSNAELVDWRRGEVPHTIRAPFDEQDTVP